MAKIISVDKGSIADEIGLKPGDSILKVNDRTVTDILVFRFLTTGDEYELTVQKENGEIEIIDIVDDFEEGLGVEFENPLMSKAKSCANKCIFCFIDQLPKGMRESLYFKDDDTRLSFLHGNYITMTNVSDKELEDMINIHISPINISVHCTDGKLREFMLGNKKAGRILEQIKKLSDAKITMNCQIVLCKGINDNQVLDNTINDLKEFVPQIESICIVPLGITKFRDGLYEMEPFNKEDCIKIVRQVEKWQKIFMKEQGSRVVYIADEFYIKGEIELPEYEEYEEFPQLENGVGMAVLTENEFLCELKYIKKFKKKKVSIATGKISESLIKNMVSKLENIDCQVFGIRNDFFGETITVSGLVTAGDIINQLKGKDLGEALLIPENMLRADTDVFLDDLTVSDVEKQLNIKVVVIKDGADLAQRLAE